MCLRGSCNPLYPGTSVANGLIGQRGGLEGNLFDVLGGVEREKRHKGEI